VDGDTKADEESTRFKLAGSIPAHWHQSLIGEERMGIWDRADQRAA